MQWRANAVPVPRLSVAPSSVPATMAAMQNTALLAPHIAALDDDPQVRQLVADYLGENELRVTAVATGRELAAVLARETIDLVILDLRLAGEDGMQIARRLRGDVGAADPHAHRPRRGSRPRDGPRARRRRLPDQAVFSPRELLARIRALLRRSKAQAERRQRDRQGARLPLRRWELSIGLRRLKHRDGRQVELTNGEFSLLAAFLSAPQRVLTRDQLLDLSRLHNAEVYDRSIDVQILRLRRKIEADPAHPGFITTQRGAGYVFAAEVEAVR